MPTAISSGGGMSPLIVAFCPFNASLKNTPNQSPPKLLTVFFQSQFIQKGHLQCFLRDYMRALFTVLFSPFHFSSSAMISAQQPLLPNKIQRVMDCQTEEEETCEEQYDSENCTCSSKSAESYSGLIQFKSCNCLAC